MLFIVVCVSESRREARKAFLAFSRDKDGPELAEIESSRSESEKYPERSDDIFGGTKSTPVSILRPWLLIEAS